MPALPTSLAALLPGLHLGDRYALALLFVGAVLVAGLWILSRQAELPFSATILYVVAGAVASLGLGALGVHRLGLIENHRLFERVTELALVVAVFGSGLAVERTVRRSSWILIGVLLAVVMPVTIALVALFGIGAMGLGAAAAIVLGAVLTPTDPVLAGDVGVSAPGQPEVGEPRLSLHTEAGANDGLASPFVVLGLLAATHSGTGWLGGWIGVDLLARVAIAVAVGVASGWLAAAVLRARDLTEPDLYGLLGVGVALAVYGAADLLGGYGLVAVFVAGIVFRRRETDELLHARMHRGTEMLGRLLELAVLVGLGSTLTGSGLAVPGVGGWLLAPLIIFVLRPALVLIACLGSPLHLRARLFLGFFGVRGVAALYYAAIVAGSHALGRHDTAVVVWTTVVCVAISIVVHGVSATPLMRRWLSGQPLPS